ncbi:MerR family transcriptional regulator [Thalassobacillus sp. CUG 92003]|uniref:MerR family transcriptional regulator n=1 Tax=Thalassobacillus sp. CUG 92003 TaxID=2736641 RepID=UPI0015E66629|nr:MerR family transcriptional regulator [Thalassobacillus sp. CUG 92003]
MSEKLYTVGELAELSGSTIRTIQYYDKIGLLVAKRENNLRYYTQHDLLTLQQILFYKKLGLPLKEIKNHLVNSNNKSAIKNALKTQSNILFQKEMEIKMNIAIIEAIVATMDSESSNFDLGEVIKIALKLNKETIFDYSNVSFDQKTSDLFKEKNVNEKEIIEVYWLWKKLVLEAAYHKINALHYKSDTGYQFGKKWHEFIGRATDHDPEMIEAYTSGLEQRHQWPEEDLFLFHFCNDFIEGAHHYYCEKTGDQQ